ncbi:hypothetical protein [Streptomyces halobius]|uniref:Uncharacterized protein n=1 Tax=Streptomyces halobius TaxID=2879846 RepID=A0ABY4MBJ7_9ACTN|nr:hypothetical protein [Streptomyces halobius]UQA93671.1 hypothetical protein K9S39_19025 [Streptomyces halobius]
MLHKRLPLLTAAEIITRLGLNAHQIGRATTAMEQIVRRAWRYRTGPRRALNYEEFADTVPTCHWVLMFEVCALIHLGRHAEACALTAAARIVRPGRGAGPSGGDTVPYGEAFDRKSAEGMAAPPASAGDS